MFFNNPKQAPATAATAATATTAAAAAMGCCRSKRVPPATERSEPHDMEGARGPGENARVDGGRGLGASVNTVGRRSGRYSMDASELQSCPACGEAFGDGDDEHTKEMHIQFCEPDSPIASPGKGGTRSPGKGPQLGAWSTRSTRGEWASQKLSIGMALPASSDPARAGQKDAAERRVQEAEEERDAARRAGEEHKVRPAPPPAAHARGRSFASSASSAISTSCVLVCVFDVPGARSTGNS